MQYRADIDGLRTLAVLPVVLFHAGYGVVSGGFVGVDVFFVISGYLITRIISQELAAGTFSIATFYRKRASRLLPVLFTVVLSTLAIGYVMLTPEELVKLAHSSAAASLFVSNVYFTLTQDYFALDSQTLPLLHTWSLGVEEQFYIAFPLLLWLLTCLRSGTRTVKTVLLGIAALSFAAACVAIQSKPMATFYLLPFRAWELMVGALLAVNIIPALRSVRINSLLALLGLTLVVLPVFTYTKGTVFPGPAALMPVLGAALIIYSGEGTLTWLGKCLSRPAMVFIGKISYSLYMWHWPLFVFTNIYYEFSTPAPVRVAMVATAFVIAALSWRYLENPTRTVLSRASNMQAAACTASLLVVLSVAALLVHSQGGFRDRLDEQAASSLLAMNDISPYREKCHFIGQPIKSFYSESCVIGAPTAPDTAIWGDSHGVELAAAMGDLLVHEGRALRQITASACPPALNYTPRGRPQCAAFNEEMLQALEKDESIKHVVLATYYKSSSYEHNWLSLITGLEQTIQRLKDSGKEVVIGYPIPDYQTNVPLRVARSSLLKRDEDRLYLPTEAFKQRHAEAFSQIARLSATYGVNTVAPYQALCHDKCSISDQNGLFYFDGNHLSMNGARAIADQYLEALRLR